MRFNNLPTLYIVWVLLLSPMFALGQETKLNPNKVSFPDYKTEHRDNIRFPKVMGYDVLTCDFHSHTVFSDGLLWPSERLSEAWRGGLDALAITDHIEYLPHKKYITSDLNASYDIAKVGADELGFMLIKGTEITRKQATIGHFNALFISDANTIAKDDPKESILEAKKQGAFLIWNHPGWAVDSTYIKDFQADLFKDGLIQGIEVYNNNEFYPRALSWAIDKKLTIIAATDVHGMVEQNVLREEKTLRPMTLVLSKKRSLKGIKDALENGRTLAYFHNTIAAREDIASAFVEACISFTKVSSADKRDTYMLTNCADMQFKLKVNSREYTLPAQASITLSLPVDLRSVKVEYLNVYIYENRTLARDLQIN